MEKPDKTMPEIFESKIDDMRDDTAILKEILRELRAIRHNTKSVELELSVIKIHLMHRVQ